VTDRRTDRITTPKTALAYARAVKTKFLGQSFQEITEKTDRQTDVAKHTITATLMDGKIM